MKDKFTDILAGILCLAALGGVWIYTLLLIADGKF